MRIGENLRYGWAFSKDAFYINAKYSLYKNKRIVYRNIKTIEIESSGNLRITSAEQKKNVAITLCAEKLEPLATKQTLQKIGMFLEAVCDVPLSGCSEPSKKVGKSKKNLQANTPPKKINRKSKPRASSYDRDVISTIRNSGYDDNRLKRLVDAYSGGDPQARRTAISLGKQCKYYLPMGGTVNDDAAAVIYKISEYLSFVGR